jgi:hypothetical protein
MSKWDYGARFENGKHRVWDSPTVENMILDFIKKKLSRIKCLILDSFFIRWTLLKSNAGVHMAMYTGFIKRIRVLNTGILIYFIDCPASRTIVSSSITNCFALYDIGVFFKFWVWNGSLHLGGAIMCAMDIAVVCCCQTMIQLIPVCCRDWMESFG